MDNKTVISVSDVSKSFKVFFDKSTSLKERILFQKRRRCETHEVLKGISLSVRQGEAIGIIGANGSGKSTLLKLLSRIMYPDSGSIAVSGRVSALIELGAGFHPDMSGRENIYTNASIFGLSKKEIDEKLHEIIAFSGLGDYIDNPVRTYSSGMYMRLAFSVAINVDADILLIDEILAVGDASFQAKCFSKLREIKASGTTIVIVSHSLGQIEQFCDRSIWICDGKIKAEGTPWDVHPAYLDYMGREQDIISAAPSHDEPHVEDLKREPKASNAESEEKAKIRWGNGAVRITHISLTDKSGKPCNSFATGATMNIRIDYNVIDKADDLVFGIGIFRNDGVNCYGTNTNIDRMKNTNPGIGGTVVFSTEAVFLLPGEYSVDVAIHTEDGFAYDYYRFAEKFIMYSDLQDVGVSRIEHKWSISVSESTQSEVFGG